jgi:hypothetical protein
VFVYLKAAAAYAANPWRMPPRELRMLEQAFEQARAHGDQRTAQRLHELLSAATGKFLLPDEDVPGDLDEQDDAIGKAMLEMMLAAGGEDQFLDIARRQLGKDMVDELRRTLGGNKKQFARALLDLLTDFALPVAPALGPGNRGANAAEQSAAGAPPRAKRRPPPPGQKDLFDD